MDGAAIGANTAFYIPPAVEERPQIHMGWGVLGIETERGAKSGQRTLAVAPLIEGQAQVEVGGDPLRVQFKGVAIGAQCTLDVAMGKARLAVFVGNSCSRCSVPSLGVQARSASQEKKKEMSHHNVPRTTLPKPSLATRQVVYNRA